MNDNNVFFDEDIPTSSEQEERTSVTKCPACGANMVFDSENGTLYCEHCGSRREIISKTSEEQDFERTVREIHRHVYGRHGQTPLTQE